MSEEIKTTIEPSIEKVEKKSRKGQKITFVIVLILVLAWVLIKPGVFTVQPIGALPDGITIIYSSRNPEMPFFSSPDGLCLEIQGNVTLLCRAAGLGAVSELSDRILLRLPYMHWTYLLSTGGAEFDS